MICNRCNLHKECITNCLGGNGSEHPVVLFVGEAPGRNEDEQGRAFIGEAGKLLRGLVEEANINDWPVRFTNAVRCRPPNNKTPDLRHIEKCAPFLQAEIKRYQPRIVVPLGAVALKSLLNEGGITKVRGRKFIREGRVYLPTLHPAFILRNKDQEGILIDDILTVFNDSIFESKSAEVEVLTAHQVYDYLKDFSLFSFDIEATGLDPYSKKARTLCIAFSAEPHKAKLIEIPDTTGMNSPKIHAEFNDIIYWLRKIFSLKSEVIIQNGKYDCSYLRSTLGIEVENWVWDTMLMSYALDERAEHGLKAMTSRFLPTYAGYEEEILQNLKTRKMVRTLAAQPMLGMADADPAIRNQYCGTDAVVTFLLFSILKTRLELEGMMTYYRDVLHPITETLMQIQQVGCKIDLDQAKSLSEQIISGLLAIESSIRSTPAGSAFLKDNEKINFNSKAHVSSLLFEYEELSSKKKTKTGKPETRKKTLALLQNPLANLLVERSGVAKLASTYSGAAVFGDEVKGESGWLRDDGMAHAEFNINTTTGRLSCNSPNLQNIPKKSTSKSYPIKNIFCSRFVNGLIGVADYKQIELRIFSVLANDQKFIDVFRAGGDPHGMVVEELNHVCKKDVSELVWEDYRSKAKTVNFGIIYGETSYGLYENNGETQTFWRKYLTDYFAAHPSVLKFRLAIIQELLTYGYVTSKFGARRHFPDFPKSGLGENELLEYTLENEDDDFKPKVVWYDLAAIRQAVNHPIQNPASTMNALAARRLQGEFKRRNWKSEVFSLVHDSILFDLHPKEAEKAYPLIVSTMENTGLDWMTLDTPIDFSLGPSWGTAETI
jgi:DNA polymerase-1